MCGIIGIISKNDTIDLAHLNSARDTFSYRGPDDQGSWLNENQTIYLGHRRLSIIDTSSSGHQPMQDRNSGCVIVFNGEIYNYLEIRADLEQKGIKFHTHSDTEVALQAYLFYGESCVEQFNGMFALAIWDPRNRRIFLLRDRLGIKPLYYYQRNDLFIFSSEVKGITSAIDEKPAVNNGLIDHYMSFGYIPGAETLQTDVKRLLPGHSACYSVTQHTLAITSYWDLPNQTETDRGEAYYLEAGRGLINSAIDLRLRSDVPLGIFLSGGIDSSAVVGLLASRTTEQLKTFSVAYDFGKAYDETAYARKVANKFNTDHHELFIKPDDFREFIPRYIELMDEPVTESAAISLYFLAEMTKQSVTVVLSGEGSDEVFGGYDLYRYMTAIDRYRRFATPGVAGLLSKLALLPGLKSTKVAKYLNLSALPLEKRYKGISTYDARIKEKLYRPDFMEQIASSETHRKAEEFLQSLFEHRRDDPLSRMLYFDTKTWLIDDLLIKADRMSMAASLELRVPFLDYRLVEFASKMPSHYKIRDGRGKYLLKKIVEGLLPDEIINRKKMGFPTPLKLMFQGALQEYSNDLLRNPNSRISAYFNRTCIDSLLDEHQSNQSDHHRIIWQLVVLEEWLKKNG